MQLSIDASKAEPIYNFLIRLKGWIVDGFSIGNLTISLWNILLGILFFILFLRLFQWFKSKLETKWLLKSNLSKGAKDATASLFWYASVSLTLIIALSIAGLNIGNFALVAGALSVGIGFGLQNIVSNFISGLILLFERPINKGDWIIVGDTQGFVREINIRSTRIQTFDFADVLIPNSDLLTNNVTNWMLTNPIGRIRIPIGVAYESDVIKVRDLLLKIACEHNEVIRDDKKIADPQVLFLKFADSCLEFELRVFIKEIMNNVRISSELNFEIARQFKEAKIQIPFPQRDIHIKTTKDLIEGEKD